MCQEDQGLGKADYQTRSQRDFKRKGRIWQYFALRDSLESKIATILCGDGRESSVVQRILGKCAIHLSLASVLKESEEESQPPFFLSLRTPHLPMQLGSPCLLKHKRMGYIPSLSFPPFLPRWPQFRKEKRIFSVPHTI